MLTTNTTTDVHVRYYYVIVRPSVLCLSVVCTKHSCTLLRGLKFAAILRRMVR